MLFMKLGLYLCTSNLTKACIFEIFACTCDLSIFLNAPEA